MYKYLLILVIMLILPGCSAPGPMQMYGIGPYKTQVFDPIALYSIDNGADKIEFKATGMLYEKREKYQFVGKIGVFIVHNKGVNFLVWDTTNYIYKNIYQIDFEDIIGLKEITHEVAPFYNDRNMLVITDKNNIEPGFIFEGIRSARAKIEYLKGG